MLPSLNAVAATGAPAWVSGGSSSAGRHRHDAWPVPQLAQGSLRQPARLPACHWPQPAASFLFILEWPPSAHTCSGSSWSHAAWCELKHLGELQVATGWWFFPAGSSVHLPRQRGGGSCNADEQRSSRRPVGRCAGWGAAGLPPGSQHCPPEPCTGWALATAL
jgi:hypothetical protein